MKYAESFLEESIANCAQYCAILGSVPGAELLSARAGETRAVVDSSTVANVLMPNSREVMLPMMITSSPR
jgi:hypothetical protein